MNINLIRAAIYAGRLNLAIINKIYDLEDYVNPIKVSFDDRFSYRVAQGFTKVVNIYVK